jgi:hypothetical protein
VSDYIGPGECVWEATVTWVGRNDAEHAENCRHCGTEFQSANTEMRFALMEAVKNAGGKNAVVVMTSEEPA